MVQRMKWVLLLLALGASSGSQASNYLIEILVFARDDPGASEYLPPDPGLPDYSGTATPGEVGQMLDPAQGQLGPERHTLTRSGAGQPLFHGLWRQPVGSRNNPRKVRITSSEQRDGLPQVEGVVAIGRGRFLHLHLDLLTRPLQGSSGQPTYRLIAQRRMGSNELHYIDHPKVGVLVRIRP